MLLGEFGVMQIVARAVVRVRRLAVRTHDAATRCDTLIKKLLHHRFLIEPARQTHTITLPVGASPVRLEGQTQPFDISKQLRIARGEGPAARSAGKK